MKIKLKICGMKYPENIQAIAELASDYLGFIFFEKSKRNFEGEIPKISKKIKKTGVFVNASEEFILKKIKKYKLKAIQLHGDESAEFCQKMMQIDIEVIKVFSVGNHFDFEKIRAYESVCDYFLFDTKGKERGGNGIVFNWELLNNYPSTKPYFLSGGIGLEEVDSLKLFLKSKASNYCFALDINSRFEIKLGLKNIEKLKEFKQSLKIGE